MLNRSLVARAAGPVPHASTAQTSRWWTFACSDGNRGVTTKPPCVLRLYLRGTINPSSLHLIQEGIRHGETARHALGRPVAIEVDLDTRGGEVFSAMEIGRLLRSEAVSIRVAPGAECISACIFVLMGATGRAVAPTARVGIHRPSLGGAGREGLVDAMSAPLVSYAQQMHASRRIVDDMLAIPADRIRYLSAPELASYGIDLSDD